MVPHQQRLLLVRRIHRRLRSIPLCSPEVQGAHSELPYGGSFVRVKQGERDRCKNRDTTPSLSQETPICAVALAEKLNKQLCCFDPIFGEGRLNAVGRSTAQTDFRTKSPVSAGIQPALVWQ